MKYISYLIGYFLLTALMVIASCSKMNDLHDDYFKDGEIIYTGRVDSAQIFAGNKRVLLRYWVSDIKANKLLIYWLSRSDSLIFDIPEKPLNNSVEVFITDLPEGSLYFELITLNRQMANRSVPFNTACNVYGNKYQSSLLNRTINSTSKNTATRDLTITWGGALEKSIGTEIEYLDSFGSVILKRISAIEKYTTLTDVANGLKYRTLYLPEPTAIDTFYTDFSMISLNE